MVQQMVGAYTLLGHSDIKAGYVGHENGAPLPLGVHLPDVTALAGAVQIPIICDVETRDTLNSEHTRSQLLTFRSAADKLGGVLHVGLPFKSDVEHAKRVVAGWGILVDQWWYGVAL